MCLALGASGPCTVHDFQSLLHRCFVLSDAEGHSEQQLGDRKPGCSGKELPRPSKGTEAKPECLPSRCPGTGMRTRSAVQPGRRRKMKWPVSKGPCRYCPRVSCPQDLGHSSPVMLYKSVGVFCSEAVVTQSHQILQASRGHQALPPLPGPWSDPFKMTIPSLVRSLSPVTNAGLHSCCSPTPCHQIQLLGMLIAPAPQGEPYDTQREKPTQGPRPGVTKHPTCARVPQGRQGAP